MNLVWKDKRKKRRSMHDILVPSTRWELRHDHGNKQCCSEYVFGAILDGTMSVVKAMLCHGSPSSECVCPPRYSSCDNQETLLEMAIQSFGPPTRLSLDFYNSANRLLKDPRFVSSVEELECRNIESLSTSFQVDVLKTLLPQLKILHVYGPLGYRWLRNCERIIDMFLITPPKKQELGIFYLPEDVHLWEEVQVHDYYCVSGFCRDIRTLSFSTSDKVVYIEDWEVHPPWTKVQDDEVIRSLMRKYPFTLDPSKRKCSKKRNINIVWGPNHTK